MDRSVYEFSDYKHYLTEALPVSGEGRGSRNRLSEILNCQKGFISQVLNGKVHFSLEHAIKISRFLNHDEGEEEFFLLLMHLGRSGSQELSEFYKKRMKEILARRKEIKARIRSHSTLSEAEQMIYYSSWHCTAVHMCLMIPRLHTKRAICEFLGLPTQTVSRILEFLQKCGLAEQSGDHWKGGPARIHLPSDSPLVSKHHSNWRMQAIASLDQPGEQDLHYSAILSLSEEAASKMRAILLDAIQATEPILKECKDETVYALNADLFRLGKSV